MIFEWIGLIFLTVVLAVLLRDDLRHIAGKRRTAQGEVTGHRSSYDEGSRTYVARVAYTDHRGQRHEVEDTVGRAEPNPPVGDAMPVVYPEAHPDRGRVPRPVLRGIIYLFVSGALMLLVARMLGWVSGEES